MWLSRYCTGLKNILAITELIIATLLDRVLKVRQSKLLRVSVLTQKSSPHKPYTSPTSSLPIHRYKWPVSSIIATIVSGIYGFLLGAQGTSNFKPRGSPGSNPLRSDGSRDDQAGEAGPVEQSSAEAKSLKLRGKGLSGCHPSGQPPRQQDGGPKGLNKELLSRQFTKRNRA